MRKWRIEFKATGTGGQSWPLYSVILSDDLKTATLWAFDYCENSALKCECVSITELVE